VTLDELSDRLKGVRRRGGRAMARCPAHDDHRSSLSLATGHDGRVLVHCHAACRPEVIVHALGLELRDLFPGARAVHPTVHKATRLDDAQRAILQEARRQPWHDEAHQLNYLVADRLRALRRRADQLRHAITCAGETEAAWRIAAEAAALDFEAACLELDLDEALV
jgi:hypothetical protein